MAHLGYSWCFSTILWPITCDPLPVTRYLWPATCDPLPVTRYLWPVTCDPLPVTRYLWPVTCDPLPVTHYLWPMICDPLPVTCVLAPPINETKMTSLNIFLKSNITTKNIHFVSFCLVEYNKPVKRITRSVKWLGKIYERLAQCV